MKNSTGYWPKNVWNSVTQAENFMNRRIRPITGRVSQGRLYITLNDTVIRQSILNSWMFHWNFTISFCQVCVTDQSKKWKKEKENEKERRQQVIPKF